MTEPTAGPSQHNNVPYLLIPETLGFSPQLLLDDIINIANNAVQDGVNGMEEFLQKWVDERAQRKNDDWDSTQEVEQGLVSFQTLLEHHTDIAFDFFEAWSLRNIFAIPSDLPIVVPHQQNLDLTLTPEREQELMDEIDELRKQIDKHRRIKRMMTQAIRMTKSRRRREEMKLEKLAILKSPSLDVLGALPSKILSMYKAVSALPSLDPSVLASLSSIDPGKRLWETGTAGYKSWAVAQLLDAAEGTGRRSVVDTLAEKADQVGRADQLRAAVEVIDGVWSDLSVVNSSRAEEMEE